LSKYKYTDPVDSGFTKFKLTKKQHNEIFPKRKIKWTDRYEYFYNKHSILLHKFASWKAVLLSTILLPLIILLEGIANIKDIWREIVGLYKQKELGKFVPERIWKKENNKYQQVMDIIKLK
jgi:hypothetical protein